MLGQKIGLKELEGEFRQLYGHQRTGNKKIKREMGQEMLKNSNKQAKFNIPNEKIRMITKR